ncbi:putative 21 kDa protein-like [Iris pallida]|uniref:21 kDa protein-like n=1 Tax=Iris pallida TaxID=29817 RepID=A0AAX6FQB7_IRIPA|nr:putative 21 kDa protein-like [Iris pallida]
MALPACYIRTNFGGTSSTKLIFKSQRIISKKKKMAAKWSYYSSLLVLLLAYAYAAEVQSLPPSPFRDAPALDFIRTSCNSTLYPSLCFASLSPYANAVGGSPVRLAHLAVNVTRGHARALSAHVSALRRAPPWGRMSTREWAALQDCAETLGDAVDLAWRSALELGQVDRSPSGPETGWHVFNVQTWMSGAMTNEQTCTDGFDAVVAGSAMKTDVCGRVSRLKQYTSNALALVNCLVAG